MRAAVGDWMYFRRIDEPGARLVADKGVVLPTVEQRVDDISEFLGPFVERQHFTYDPRVLAALGYLAVLATLLTFGVQTWAQQRLPPVRMALLSALEPVFAAIWAAVLIGERLSGRELSGGALIVLGVVVGETGAALLARPRGPPV